MSHLNINITQALPDFTLAINTQISLQGITAIYGASGSGKTSLLRAIAGLNKQATGSISLNNNQWLKGGKHLATHKRRIAYVFQEHSLFSHLNVEGNLHYSQRRSGNTEPKIDELYRQKLLSTLNIKHLLNRQIHSLSGGEKQRVAIVRALLNKPQILLMDEPLSALDDSNRQAILQLLVSLKSILNIPIIYVSHSLTEISQIADHLIWIKQGKVIAQDKALPLIHRIQNERIEQGVQSLFTVVDATFSHNENHISIVQVGGTALSVHTLDDEAVQSGSLRFMLWAKDISIALSKNNDSSILNILPATIVAIQAPLQYTQIIELDCSGFHCFVQLTQHSCERLDLKKGMPVFAQVKAVSLLK